MKENKINKVKRIDLDKIDNPKFLATLSYKELDVLAEDVRQNIIKTTSIYGGHLSSNLGVVEVTIALNRSFDFSNDKLILDVGHQCYAYKILTGRSLEHLRSKDGVSGFQKRCESKYDCYEAGHSSTSISAANGFAIARDLNGEDYNVVALIGDGSVVSGLAFEGLNNLASGNHKVIVVLNDNGMSISKPAGGIGKMFARISSAAGYNRIKVRYKRSMLKTKLGKKIYNLSSRFKNWLKSKLVPLTIFDAMGLSYIGPIDGHNIKAMEKAFKRAKNTTKSVVVHVCTLKGKGYKPAENDQIGYWHGVSPFEIESGKPLDMHEGFNSWSHIFSDLTIKEMENHKKAYLISPATIKGAGLDDVFAKFPNRSVDVGIAEEHSMTLASGLSLGGYHPIISIYSTFMQRAFDEISHDLARMNCNATILVDRAGLVGKDGETHQGIYDVSFLVNTPNVVVTMPSTIAEGYALYDESFNDHGPFFIRLPRAIVKIEKDIKPAAIKFGKWEKLIDSKAKKIAVVGVGPLLRDLEKQLIDKKIECTLYNALYIAPMDEDAIDELLNFDKIVIYDAYSANGGLESVLVNKLSQKGYKGLISAHSIPLQFIKQASINEQLEEFGLLPEQIIKFVK